jgi:hypothetical protein
VALIEVIVDAHDDDMSYAAVRGPSGNTHSIGNRAQPGDVEHSQDLNQDQSWSLPPEHQTSSGPSFAYHQNFSPFDKTGPQQESPLHFMPVYSPGVQQVRSIETLDHSNVQLCGTSAELDPWLLRHCKFDELGISSHGKTKLRNVGGVPVDNIVPVHFTVVEDGVYEPIDPEAKSQASSETRRQELNAMVPPAQGLRLISLFVGIQPHAPMTR